MATEEPRYPLITVVPAEWDFTDYAATFSIEMSLIHNVIIRGLNSIWYNAPAVKKADEVAFAGYSLAWIDLLHHHHHGEETIIFPFLQTKLDMKDNIDQHAAFCDQVDAFKDYMQKVFEAKETYDGEQARKMVEVFGDTLVGHLNDEIPTITPERLGQFDKKELGGMVAALSETIKALPMTAAHTMVMLHHDLKTYPSWPPAPVVIKWVVKNVAYWRYRSYWKFAPFSRHAEPQKYVV